MVLFLIIVFQGVFLALILKEGWSSPYASFQVPVFLIIGAGLTATYLKIRLHHKEYLYEDIGVAVWVPVGAMTTYFLSTKMSLGPVIAGGITGTVGSYLPSLYKGPVYLKKIPFAIYCGAFVGMSSPEVAPAFGFVLEAGIIAGVLLVLSKSLFLGVGGKLGVLAFGSVVTAAVLLYVLKMPL